MQHPPRVASKRQIGKKPLLILTGALVALAAAFVLLLPTIKRAFPSGKYPDPTIELRYKTLKTVDANELESVTITHLAGDSYTLRYKDGALWLVRGEELLAINEAYSDELLKAATVITVEDVVTEDASEVAQHLSDMGLAPPQAIALVRYAGGREVTLELGTGVPDTSYSYFRFSGDGGVYMCSVDVSDALSLTANRLLPVEQPVLDKALTDRITLRLQSGVQIDMLFSTDSAGQTCGRLESPIGYPMSAAATSAMLTAMENFRLGTAIGAVTPENRVEYGFDAPLAVLTIHRQAGAHAVVGTDGQLTAEELHEAEFRFTLGRAEDNYFYTCLYEGECYHVSRFLFQAFVEANASELVTRNPADLGDAMLSSIVVQTDAGVLDVRASRTERVLPNNQLETDENGELVYDTAVTFNGEPATQEQYDALLKGLKALTVFGDLKESWTADGKTPRWQITLTTEGGTVRTIAAYALDAFTDALVVDGEALHTAYVEALETALAQWTPR